MPTKETKFNYQTLATFYVILFVAFIFYIVFMVVRETPPTGSSDIPEYNYTIISSAYEDLQIRTQLQKQTPLDLTGFEFGKEEPFQ